MRNILLLFFSSRKKKPSFCSHSVKLSHPSVRPSDADGDVQVKPRRRISCAAKKSKFMIMRRYKITEDCIKWCHEHFLVVSFIFAKRSNWRREEEEEFHSSPPSSSSTILLLSLFFLSQFLHKITFFRSFSSAMQNVENFANKEFFSHVITI